MHFKKMGMAIIGLSNMGFAQTDMAVQVETFWIWIALFALGLVGITILFVTSLQTQKMQHLHQSIMNKQLEMEKNQNLLLTNMSENIHDMAKKALYKSHEALDKKTKSYRHKEKVLANIETRLLDVTNELLDFLRLKSKKIEIINEEFNINNVLNELSGSICSQFSGSEVELIFDIDKNVPRRLVGDSLHLGQTLKSILEYLMDQQDLDEVRLEITMFDTYEELVELQFQFTDTGMGLDSDTLDELFMPYYDDENGSFVGLGLFVAHELVHMMGGKLSVQSVEEKGTTFTLSLPFDVVEKSDQRKYRLPEKVLIEKKVFIVDTNYNSALAVKKMFAYFRHEVTVISQDEFMRNIPNLTPYDIVVLHESFFTIRLVEYLNKIKLEKELKVVTLNSLLQTNKQTYENEIIDANLFKPLNQERVFEMIVNMYDIKVPVHKEEEQKKKIEQAQTHRKHITETKDVTQHSFKVFSGKHILIVEDNIINQKVLMSLLSYSGMSISIANNGQEAVDLVKEGDVEFDLVLMDINMPIMDGYAATQMIRLDSKFDSMPIVAFTALVLDSEIQKMFNCGINAFLAKPLNIGKLYTVLDIYLSDTSSVSSKEKEEEPKQEIIYQGINIKEGIKHANNSEALYMEVLKEFNTAYGTSDEIFTKLIREHRYEQVKMLCVDMRGLTGTIGAEDMHTLVTEILNKILYKKYDMLTNYNEKYQTELKALNHSIKQYVDAA
jgi:CheY-like chemotaxis protein/signal transduction histidine kinase